VKETRNGVGWRIALPAIGTTIEIAIVLINGSINNRWRVWRVGNFDAPCDRGGGRGGEGCPRPVHPSVKRIRGKPTGAGNRLLIVGGMKVNIHPISGSACRVPTGATIEGLEDALPGSCQKDIAIRRHRQPVDIQPWTICGIGAYR